MFLTIVKLWSELVNDDIEVTRSVRSVGFYMDSTMNNMDNVAKICRSAYLTLRNISRIRSKISTMNKAKILVQSLVISKIDYCNAYCYKHSQVSA